MTKATKRSPVKAHTKPKRKKAKAKKKIEIVMEEFKEGALRSGSKKGPKVTSRKQAIAIALNMSRKAKKKK